MKVVRTALWALLLLPLASPAFAVIWYEADHAPEAGHTIASAQLPGSSTTAIHGTFADRLDGSGGYEFVDVDMYRIEIYDLASFKAETWSYHVDEGESQFSESELYLFNADGEGLVFNEDYTELDGTEHWGAQITNAVGLPVEDYYYLAVSRYLHVAMDATGTEMWDPGGLTGEWTPEDPFAVLTSWDGDLYDDSGWGGPNPITEYEVRLTGARGADSDIDPIPEPSAMAILLLGGGLLLVRRFRY